MAIITIDKNYLFVDGRYTVQAKIQSGNDFKIFDITSNPPFKVLKNKKLGLDPKIFTKKSVDRLFSKKIKIREIEENLVDKIIRKKLRKTVNSLVYQKKLLARAEIQKLIELLNILRKLKLIIFL